MAKDTELVSWGVFFTGIQWFRKSLSTRFYRPSYLLLWIHRDNWSFFRKKTQQVTSRCQCWQAAVASKPIFSMKKIKTESWAQIWCSREAKQGGVNTAVPGVHQATPGSVTSDKLSSLHSCFSWFQLHKLAAGLALLSGHSALSSVLEAVTGKTVLELCCYCSERVLPLSSLTILVSCMSSIGACEYKNKQVFLNIHPYFTNWEGLKELCPAPQLTQELLIVI